MNIDPHTLTLTRYLNLVWYRMTSLGVRIVDVEKGAPEWWTGDEDASDSSLLAARMLGVGNA